MCPGGKEGGRTGTRKAFLCPGGKKGGRTGTRKAFLCQGGKKGGRKGTRKAFLCPGGKEGGRKGTRKAFLCPGGKEGGRKGTRKAFLCQGRWEVLPRNKYPVRFLSCLRRPARRLSAEGLRLIEEGLSKRARPSAYKCGSRQVGCHSATEGLTLFSRPSAIRWRQDGSEKGVSDPSKVGKIPGRKKGGRTGTRKAILCPGEKKGGRKGTRKAFLCQGRWEVLPRNKYPVRFLSCLRRPARRLSAEGLRLIEEGLSKRARPSAYKCGSRQVGCHSATEGLTLFSRPSAIRWRQDGSEKGVSDPSKVGKIPGRKKGGRTGTRKAILCPGEKKGGRKGTRKAFLCPGRKEGGRTGTRKAFLCPGRKEGGRAGTRKGILCQG